MKIPYWLEAINDEIEALKSNNTWTLSHRPTCVNTVESKWVFRMKFNEDGTVDRFKARLLSHKYSQIHGLDYHETFIPVVKPTMIRLILAIAVHLKCSMRQVDIKNIFLHGLLRKQYIWNDLQDSKIQNFLTVFANSIGRRMDLSKHHIHGLIICHSFFFIVVFLLHNSFYASLRG